MKTNYHADPYSKVRILIRFRPDDVKPLEDQRKALPSLIGQDLSFGATHLITKHAQINPDAVQELLDASDSGTLDKAGRKTLDLIALAIG